MKPQSANGLPHTQALRLTSTTQPCVRLQSGSESDHAHRHQARRDDRLLLGPGARMAGDFCFPRVSVEARMSFTRLGSLPKSSLTHCLPT